MADERFTLASISSDIRDFSANTVTSNIGNQVITGGATVNIHYFKPSDNIELSDEIRIAIDALDKRLFYLAEAIALFPTSFSFLEMEELFGDDDKDSFRDHWKKNIRPLLNSSIVEKLKPGVFTMDKSIRTVLFSRTDDYRFPELRVQFVMLALEKVLRTDRNEMTVDELRKYTLHLEQSLTMIMQKFPSSDSTKVLNLNDDEIKVVVEKLGYPQLQTISQICDTHLSLSTRQIQFLKHLSLKTNVMNKQKRSGLSEDVRFSHAQIEQADSILITMKKPRLGNLVAENLVAENLVVSNFGSTRPSKYLERLQALITRKYINSFKKVSLPWSSKLIDLSSLYMHIHFESDDSNDYCVVQCSDDHSVPCHVDRITTSLKNTSISASAVFSDSESDSEAENKSDVDSSESECEDRKMEKKTTFQRFADLVDSQLQKKNLRVIITGTGGTGKTTTSKMFCLDWAERKHLTHIPALIRLELKEPFSEPDLFQAFQEQYYDMLIEEFTTTDLVEVKRILGSCPDKVAWLLDGLDEASPNGRELVCELFDPEKQCSQSLMVLMTRPESLKELNMPSHFSLAHLRKEQYLDFIEKFPFTDDEFRTAQRKREELLEKVISLLSFPPLMEIPFFLWTMCMLWDIQQFDSKLIGVDLYQSFVACSVKNTFLKQTEEAMRESKITRMKRQPKMMLSDQNFMIRALGYSVFRANNNRFSGNYSVPLERMEDEIRSYLKHLNVEQVGTFVDTIKKLGFFEINVKKGPFGTELVARFLHQSLRDFILSFYLAHNPDPLPIELRFANLVVEKMKNFDTSIIRCTIATLMKTDVSKEQVRCSLSHIYDYIFHTFKIIDGWRKMQILIDPICYFLQCAQNRDVLEEVIAYVVQKLLCLGACKWLDEFQQIQPQYLQLLAEHMNHPESCGRCVIPKCFQKVVFLQSKSTSSLWPEKECFALPPFIYYSEQRIMFAFPKELRLKHLDSLSISVVMKRPKSSQHEGLPSLPSLPCPLPASVRPSPVTDLERSPPSDQFPGAIFHVACAIDDVIHIWGGRQLSGVLLPPGFVWRYLPSTDEHHRDTTTGDVPPGLSCSCAVVLRRFMFVFGGRDEDRRYHNDLFRYEANKKLWTMLRPKNLPSGRSGSCGWSHGSCLYFWGGGRPGGRGDSSTLQGGDWESGFFEVTNQLLRFDTESDSWFNVETTGVRPKPRSNAAAAKISEEVIIVGGRDSQLNRLDDVWTMSLSSFAWGEIKTTGPKPPPRQSHSLTAVSQTHVILLGGWNGQSWLADLWIFDRETNTWKQDNDIPSDPNEEGQRGGIRSHTAVVAKKKLFVVGGDRNNDKLSSSIIVFDLV